MNRLVRSKVRTPTRAQQQQPIPQLLSHPVAFSDLLAAHGEDHAGALSKWFVHWFAPSIGPFRASVRTLVRRPYARAREVCGTV